MNPRSRYPHIRRTVVGLAVATVALVLVLAQPVRAVPMPSDQQARIVAEATAALEAIDAYANVRDQDAYDVYRVYADRLAARVANFLAIDTADVQRAWRNASVARQRAVVAGLTQLGVPYEKNAELPGVGLDCSGLTRFAWKSSGVTLPRGSSLQFDVSTRVTAEDAQPGDLVWRPGHVALYLGVEGAIIQAPRTGRNVEIHIVDERIWSWSRFANPLV
jgi:cell wall-associated NlpC family hydrolase